MDPPAFKPSGMVRQTIGRGHLEGLAERGFGLEQLAGVRRIIGADKSDIFDVPACEGVSPRPADPRRTCIPGKGAPQGKLQQLWPDVMVSIDQGNDPLDAPAVGGNRRGAIFG